MRFSAGLTKYRLALQKLVIGWKSAGSKGFDIPAEAEGTTYLVVPWTAQAHRFGRVFLRLEQAGMEHEVRPLRVALGTQIDHIEARTTTTATGSKTRGSNPS
jgi:hypothetical protein